MEVNRFQSAASDPIARIIQVHASSQALQPVHQLSTQCATDETNCRVKLGAAASEISRLRRGLDRFDDSQRLDDPRRIDSPERFDRRNYAVRSIGDITSNFEETPPPPISPELQNYFHVTNLGTLIDTLA